MFTVHVDNVDKHVDIQLFNWLNFKIWVWISKKKKKKPAAKELDALKWLEDFEVWGVCWDVLLEDV